MTKHELLAVVARLFALALVLALLRTIPGTVTAFQMQPDVNPVAVGIEISSYVLLGFVAILIWKFPFGIASLLLPGKDADANAVPWTQKTVVETGSIVIGLFYLFYALSDSVYWLAYGLVIASSEGSMGIPPADFIAGVVTTIFEVAIALVLVFGAQGVVRLITNMRYAGRA